MSISLTLSDLKEHFINWHNKYFSDLHNPTLISESMSNVLSQYDGLFTTAQYLLQIIKGKNYNESNIDNINIKMHEYLSSNDFQSLTDIIASYRTIMNDVNIAINDANFATEEYVSDRIADALIQSNQTPKKLQTQIINGNIDDYKESGVYQGNSSNTSVNNAISNVSDFNLFVLSYDENNTKQLLLPKNNEKIFIRYYNSTWSNWHELYGSHNTSLMQMEVTFENNDTTTYNVLYKQG